MTSSSEEISFSDSGDEFITEEDVSEVESEEDVSEYEEPDYNEKKLRELKKLCVKRASLNKKKSLYDSIIEYLDQVDSQEIVLSNEGDDLFLSLEEKCPPPEKLDSKYENEVGVYELYYKNLMKSIPTNNKIDQKLSKLAVRIRKLNNMKEGIEIDLEDLAFEFFGSLTDKDGNIRSGF